MRKLKLAMYVSLDGVVEEPAWTAPFWNDELAMIQASTCTPARRWSSGG